MARARTLVGLGIRFRSGLGLGTVGRAKEESRVMRGIWRKEAKSKDVVSFDGDVPRGGRRRK